MEDSYRERYHKAFLRMVLEVCVATLTAEESPVLSVAALLAIANEIRVMIGTAREEDKVA